MMWQKFTTLFISKSWLTKYGCYDLVLSFNVFLADLLMWIYDLCIKVMQMEIKNVALFMVLIFTVNIIDKRLVM